MQLCHEMSHDDILNDNRQDSSCNCVAGLSVGTAVGETGDTEAMELWLDTVGRPSWLLHRGELRDAGGGAGEDCHVVDKRR
jgi:hypothetical protein